MEFISLEFRGQVLPECRTPAPERKSAKNSNAWRNLAKLSVFSDLCLVDIYIYLLTTTCHIPAETFMPFFTSRVGEWLEYMEGHEAWWDKVWMEAEREGEVEVTMTPEHGPPNYQVCGHQEDRCRDFC